MQFMLDSFNFGYQALEYIVVTTSVHDSLPQLSVFMRVKTNKTKTIPEWQKSICVQV